MLSRSAQRESYGVARMPLGRLALLSRPRIPQFDGSVPRCRSHDGAVRREGYGLTPFICPFSVWCSCRASHSVTIRSHDAEATTEPSGEKATAPTPFVCSLSVRRSCHDCESHSLRAFERCISYIAVCRVLTLAKVMPHVEHVLISQHIVIL